MEIEKKFTVKEIPLDLKQYKKKEIEQGYLCGSPVVRIRKSNEQYILTYKSNYAEETLKSNTRVNQEIEADLNQEAFNHLKQKVDYNMVYKTRYIIPIEGNLTIELDIFKGKLEGLVFAEVEFPDLYSAEHFKKPKWFDQDVSADPRYSNHYLATLNEWRENLLTPTSWIYD